MIPLTGFHETETIGKGIVRVDRVLLVFRGYLGMVTQKLFS